MNEKNEIPELLSFGQRLVDITFNPSGDEKINKANILCAELADLIVNDYPNPDQDVSFLRQKLYEHTIGEILNAQMNVVKLLTLKY